LVLTLPPETRQTVSFKATSEGRQMGEEKNLDSRWRDFRRHPAVQAAAVYIGAGWAIVQAADIFVPNPDVVRWLGVILAVGFLVVVGGGSVALGHP